MSQTNYSNAVAELKHKRLELFDEIKDLKTTIKRKGEQIGSLDAAIDVFVPGFDTSRLPVKKPRTKSKLFKHGQLSGAIVDALREAGGEISTAEIVRRVMAETGQKNTDQSRVRQKALLHLNYAAKKGNRIDKIGKGADTRWAFKRFN